MTIHYECPYYDSTRGCSKYCKKYMIMRKCLIIRDMLGDRAAEPIPSKKKPGQKERDTFDKAMEILR